MLKRVFDIVAGLIALTIFIPILILIEVTVLIFDNRPIFYKRARIGRKGHSFKLVKFRIMTVEHTDSSISVNGESRITAFGAFLRKYKFDELPTLFYVVSGKNEPCRFTPQCARLCR